MRYDEIGRLYPGIEKTLGQVASLLHDDGLGPELAFGYAERWIRREVATEHQAGVAAKVWQFIAAVVDVDDKPMEEVML